MTEQEFLSYQEEMKKIYADTSYFVDAITTDYGFYGQFIEAVAAGRAKLNLQRKNVTKTVAADWIEAIEKALPALDMALRHPSVGIAEREEVLPIEFSHNITQKSLMHLSQHTDYISRIDADGTVMPSKILNVFREETNQTYENRFLNTLIVRLYDFIDRRYAILKGKSAKEEALAMSFESKFKYAAAEGTIKLAIESSAPRGGVMESDLFARIEKIHRAASAYMGSAFVKSMEGSMIKPPVMRTNAISKNKYLRQCLELWDFLEAYTDVGYEIETEEAAEKPNDGYLNMISSLLSLQYMAFNYNVSKDFEHDRTLLEERKPAQPLRPTYLKRFENAETDVFNIVDTEYRKVVNVYTQNAAREPGEGEMRIRKAIEIALREDAAIDERLQKRSRSSARK